MRYTIIERTALRAEAKEDAQLKRMLTVGLAVGEGTESENHVWLKLDFGPRDDQKGFVLRHHCDEETDAVREDVPADAIVDRCVTTELRFNEAASIKPWHVLADFLIARSIIETGMTNAASPPGSDAIGPMLVTKAEWRNWVDNGGDLVRRREETDRQDPLRQIDAAAFRMHSDMKAISALRSSDAGSDPFVPSYLDVFFAYVTGSPAAALALREAHTNNANDGQPVTKFLVGPLTEDQATAVHAARSRFFGTKEAPKTLGETITQTETMLDDALEQACEHIQTFMPSVIPAVSAPATTFAAKAVKIMNDLIRDFTLKDFQAAGILGNFGRETDGFRLFQEQRPKSGRGGIGWAQWTGSRRVNFEQFCAAKGLDPRSDEGNYAFLKEELSNGEFKNVPGHLRGTTSLDQAVKLFMDEFEKPGVPALSDRVMWARRALDAFDGVEVSGTIGQRLKEKIANRKIIFDSNSSALVDELLGLNTGTKVTFKLQTLVLKLSDLVDTLNLPSAQKQIRISSLVRTGSGSHHTQGRAVDIGNEEIAGKLLPEVATDQQVAALGIDELIFDAKRVSPQNDSNKWNYDEGQKHDFSPSTIGAHGNHMHFSVKA